MSPRAKRPMWMALTLLQGVAVVPSMAQKTAPRAAMQAKVPQQPTVPDVVGLTLATARDNLMRMRLVLVVAGTVATDKAPGTVLRQAPSAGAAVPADRTVRVTVTASRSDSAPTKAESDRADSRRRPSLAVVPNVVGTDITTARGALNAAGLTLGGYASESSDATPGQVVRQVPPAGDSVRRGSAIQLFVARPPDQKRPVEKPVSTLTTTPVQPVRPTREAALPISRAETVRALPETTIAQAMLVNARARLDSGSFERSRQLFAESLPLARTQGDSATAFFGQSFASQQVVAPDSLEPSRLSELVRSYRTAARLDSARYFVAARQNVALLYSSAGDHQGAAAEYLAGARVRDTLRPELLLSAGRELVLARQPAAAVRTLRAAATDSAVAPDAQKLLLHIYAESNDTASLLQLADTLRGPTAPLAAVNDALITSMANSGQASLHARHLMLIARNAALLDIPPADSTSLDWAWRERLKAAAASSAVADAADALIDAYRRRRGNVPYRPLAGVTWWMATNGSRVPWSSVMRSIGDWYYQTGSLRTARGFYEAAIGLPYGPMQLGERWVDLEALPPLAAIYGSLPAAAGPPPELGHLNDFVRALFGGKGEALATNDLRRIRLFRLTLGTLFAGQSRWDDGWNGAIYQLEDTRRLTRLLAQQDPVHAPHNPPEPFEALATEYRRRGCVSAAREAAGEALAEYRRREMAADAVRVETFMTALGGAVPSTATRCLGPPSY